MYKKVISLLLILSITITGCNTSQNSSNAISKTPIETNVVKHETDIKTTATENPKIFENYQYTRPNLLKSTELIETYIKRIIYATDYQESIEAYNKSKDIFNNLDEMLNLVILRYFNDTTNRFYKTELNYFINNLHYLDECKYKFQKAVLSTPHQEKILQVQSEHTKHINMEYLTGIKINRDNSIDYYNQIFDILKNYTQNNNSLETKLVTAFYNNENIDISQTEAIDDMLNIIKMQNRNAKSLNYNNYYEMKATQKNYTIQNTNTLVHHIKEIFIPLYANISTDEKKYPLYTSSKEDIFKKLITLSKTISIGFEDLINDCEKTHTIFPCNENSLNINNAFYLQNCRLPFILYNIDPQNILSINNFAYKLGQSMRLYTQNSNSYIFDKWLYYTSGYLTEVVFEQFYDLLFTDNVDNIKVNQNNNRKKRLLLQSLICEFSQYLYSNDDISKEIAIRKFDALYHEYFPKDIENTAYSATLNLTAYIIALSECDISDRLIGQVLSLQVKSLDKDDLQSIKKKLNFILMTEGGEDLILTLKNLGFPSPFNFNTITNIAIS